MEGFVRFPSTFWTRIQNDPARARADVYTQYRLPIYNFLLRHGCKEHDAEDLAQEILFVVCREEFLKRADREKGRFRSLLLGVTKNFLLRHRDRKPREAGDEALQFVPQPDDPVFDELWKQNLVERALEALMKEAKLGSPPYYQALALTKISGLSYAAAAEKLGTSVTTLTNWVHEAKARFKKAFMDQLRFYSSTEEEFQEEIARFK